MNPAAFRLDPDARIRLADLDPASTHGCAKADLRAELPAVIDRLEHLQDRFAAARTHALLIVLQGMDTSGKDGAVKHVMSGVNPQGVEVTSFKAPSADEDLHDFLWRCSIALPRRGRIGIFNRSYYEEVTAVRVHRELLAAEGAADAGPIWRERFEDINAFERHLVRGSTIVLKFFLHLSRDEQRERLLARLDDPHKHWKFSLGDVHERRYWDRYAAAYEHLLNHTSTAWAPWYVIPADRKWFMRAAVAAVIVDRLEQLDPRYPPVVGELADRLDAIRAELCNGP